MELLFTSSGQQSSHSTKQQLKKSSPKFIDAPIATMLDHELYQKCREYGMNARIWIRRFAGLLPEVYRRHLYKKKGYVSIYEFSAKLAGMNETVVDKILSIAEKLKDKPKLRSLLENGKVGWSKLQTVASIATSATDEAWAEKIQTLSKHSFVKPMRESYKPDLSSMKKKILKSGCCVMKLRGLM